MDVSAAAAKTLKTKDGGNRKEETHAVSSSIPTSHPPRSARLSVAATENQSFLMG